MQKESIKEPKVYFDIAISLDKLNLWLEKNGWTGYDPYDIKGERIFLFLQKNKYTNLVSNLFLDRYPRFIRSLFRIKKQENAKAIALFARAYINLYKESRNENYLKKALFCLNWLIDNPSKGYSGYCWGYPFDWQSRIFIPKGTPSGVVTSIAAHGFLDAYHALKDKKYLRIAKSCCNFILNDLHIDAVSNDQVCFSYTPIDHFHVHNANLFSASVLLRCYACLNEEEYKKMGIRAVNFTAARQNKDGSWYYWAPPDKMPYVIDNYHTGFVLECLNVCRRVLKEEFAHSDKLRKGLKYYANNLFLEDGTPKMRHNSIYPIDIHSCAQGIITFRELADFEPRYSNLAEKVARWAINNMQDEKGYFYYRIYKSGRIDKTPYIRWGQAWMLYALSNYLVKSSG